VWFAGLRFLWRSERPLWRALAWSYGLLFVFFAVTAGGKPYYVAGAYFFLIAAGASALQDRLGRWEWWPALTSCRSTKISASLTASLFARSTSHPNTRTMNK
jgi:hypothetical protein